MAKLITSIIRDTLTIENSKGEVEKEVSFTVNATKIAADVAKLRAEIGRKAATDAESCTELTKRLFSLIFGEKNAHELLEYYGGDAMTMTVDLAPYLVENIYPVFDNLVKRSLDMKKRMKRG